MRVNKKETLWIVTELFFPDQTSTAYILSKISNKMVEKYNVKVISGSGLYDSNSFNSISSNFKLDERIEVIHIQSKKRDKNNLKDRTLNLISMSFKLASSLYKKINKEDKVLAVTNPAPLLILLSLIKRIKKFDFIILIHDVFPENTIPAGIIKSEKSMFYKFTASIFNNSYSKANTLIVLGRDMKNVVQKKISSYKNKPNIEIIENWGENCLLQTNIDRTDIIKKRHLNSMVTLQYAGNIGRLQGLDRLIEVFKQADNPNLIFDIWGNGALKQTLKEKTSEIEMTDRINFNGSYNRKDQKEILRSADISLVTLSDGMYGLGVPSKSYNILASATPILFIGDLESEIALTVKENNVGYCFDSEDCTGLEKFLSDLSIDNLPQLEEMGRRARDIASRKYSENTILNKFIETI